MIGFALDTLLWTGALIALVLLVRRPVTQVLGARFAYALWCLPMLRLVMPPVTLPAWLKPAGPTMTGLEPANAPAASAAQPVHFTNLAGERSAAALMPPQTGDFAEAVAALPWLEAALALWLVGAGVFLHRRFSAYFALRAGLLDQACAVGTAPGLWGRSIRLIETPHTHAPLAFGVLDPVIALPPGFMASPDREGRDLALAHELAHHRGADLLVNVLAQPLFALHWFSPLSHYGWLALRRDQEAACDARVVADRSARERARYAEVIAAFAAGENAGPRLALAAAMACPVLGDKSIIHRLRILTMTDHETGRGSGAARLRRIAGRTGLAAAVIALPLTASISYAERVQQPPEAPAPPPAPAAPQPKAAPQRLAPPEAPEPPQPPLDDDAATGIEIITIDPDTGERAATTRARVEVLRRSEASDLIDEEELEETMRAVELGLAEAEQAVAEAQAEIEAATREAAFAAAWSDRNRTVVKMSCDDGVRGRADHRNARGRGHSPVTSSFTDANGTTTVTICQKAIMAEALAGLEEARAQIAQDRAMSSQIRARVLSEIERSMARMRERSR